MKNKFVILAIAAIVLSVVGPISASALPESCQDIRDADSTASDGVYTIYPNGNTQVFDVYCNDMAGTPSEYLELQNNGGPYNYAQYTAGGASPGTDVKTSYQKIRLDPATLMVDIGDQTFANTTGFLYHSSVTRPDPHPVYSVSYGVAFDCKSMGSQTGVGNIDLSGTPFAVINTFINWGWGKAGNAIFSQDDQIVNLNGGGYCGGIMPAPGMFYPFNTQGGFRLNLNYIGSQFLLIDIKPGSYPNSFNNNGHGVIPVAILGSQYLDVTTIDQGSLSLEGMAIRVVGKNNKLQSHYEDVNGDSILDLVVQIEDTEGTFTLGDTTATLTGTLMDGTLIEGQDSIRIVP